MNRTTPLTRAGWSPLFLGLAALVLTDCATGGARSAGSRPVAPPTASPRRTAATIEIYRTDVVQGGKTVTFAKLYDPGTEKVQAGILQPDGSIVPEAKPVREQVSPELRDRLATAGPQDRLPVILWLDVPARSVPTLPDTPAAFDSKAFARSEADALARYQANKDRAMARLGLTPGEVRTEVAYTPAVVAELTAARLRTLLANPLLLGARETSPTPIHLDTPRTPFGTVKEALDESGMSYVHDSLMLIGGATGKLAIWESGRCIDAVPVWLRIDPAAPGTCDRHANEVTKVAGSFDLFSYVVDSTYDTIAEETALSETSRRVLPYVVVNKSEAIVYERPEDFHKNGEINAADVLIDATANGRWGIQFTLAAGNNGGGDYVLHHSFNTLKVTTTGPSSWKNPASPHSDRELPEIAVRSSFPGGTSLSAPALAGTTTVLQDYQGAMIVPMFARAVLLASAWHQLDPGPSWLDDVKAHRDRHYGAGELDAREAYEILHATEAQRAGQAGGDRGGWWGIAYEPGDGSTFHRDYPIRLSGSGTAPFRAALAWNNGTTGPLGWGVYDLYDLDVVLLDAGGMVVGGAATFDNSYEILEAKLARGQTYTLRVLGTKPPATGAVVFGLSWDSR